MRRTIGALVAAACLAAVASARADESGVLETRHTSMTSPQNFAIEARAALYQPQVDSDPALKGNTPYANSFGTGPKLEAALEFDWQAYRIPSFGTIGPGIGVGYVTQSGPAKIVATGANSAENTTLDIFPMYAVAVLRVDVLARQAHVPLVPYLKGGLGYALWRASNTAGTSSASGVSGEGHTLGTHFAGGVALDIGVFDPGSARQLDESTGINHTYVFAEYMLSTLNGIGQTHALYVGTNSFAFGLAFEF